MKLLPDPFIIDVRQGSDWTLDIYLWEAHALQVVLKRSWQLSAAALRCLFTAPLAAEDCKALGAAAL